MKKNIIPLLLAFLQIPTEGNTVCWTSGHKCSHDTFPFYCKVGGASRGISLHKTSGCDNAFDQEPLRNFSNDCFNSTGSGVDIERAIGDYAGKTVYDCDFGNGDAERELREFNEAQVGQENAMRRFKEECAPLIQGIKDKLDQANAEQQAQNLKDLALFLDPQLSGVTPLETGPADDKVKGLSDWVDKAKTFLNQIEDYNNRINVVPKSGPYCDAHLRFHRDPLLARKDILAKILQDSQNVLVKYQAGLTDTQNTNSVLTDIDTELKSFEVNRLDTLLSSFQTQLAKAATGTAPLSPDLLKRADYLGQTYQGQNSGLSDMERKFNLLDTPGIALPFQNRITDLKNRFSIQQNIIQNQAQNIAAIPQSIAIAQQQIAQNKQVSDQQAIQASMEEFNTNSTKVQNTQMTLWNQIQTTKYNVVPEQMKTWEETKTQLDTDLEKLKNQAQYSSNLMQQLHPLFIQQDQIRKALDVLSEKAKTSPLQHQLDNINVSIGQLNRAAASLEKLVRTVKVRKKGIASLPANAQKSYGDLLENFAAIEKKQKDLLTEAENNQDDPEVDSIIAQVKTSQENLGKFKCDLNAERSLERVGIQFDCITTPPSGKKHPLHKRRK